MKIINNSTYVFTALVAEICVLYSDLKEWCRQEVVSDIWIEPNMEEDLIDPVEIHFPKLFYKQRIEWCSIKKTNPCKDWDIHELWGVASKI